VYVEDMRRHIRDLCDKHEIQCFEVARRGRAEAVLDEVYIPTIRSAISYATALHEIGHVLGRHQRSPRVMVRERWAWR
jgi:hypothetical protein